MKGLAFAGHRGGGTFGGLPGRRASRIRRSAASSPSQPINSPSSSFGKVVQAGLISGSLSLAGDVLAQLLSNRNSGASGYDVVRAARMGSFGLLLYGPYQHYWYRALDSAFPGRSLGNFAAKVAMNQLCLAPIVIASVFAWNLALQRQLGGLRQKYEQDFVTTMVNGWKFWVPAASINFYLVPLQSQVLYMSACGVLWTGYLSYSSARRQAAAA